MTKKEFQDQYPNLLIFESVDDEWNALVGCKFWIVKTTKQQFQSLTLAQKNGFARNQCMQLGAKAISWDLLKSGVEEFLKL